MTQVQARYYASGAQPLTLNTAALSTGNISVTQNPATSGWPSSFPYVALLDWGNFAGGATQEAVLVSGVSGSGPYTLNCTTLGGQRGFDTTGASAHASGITVFHAFIGADFQDMAIQRATNAVTWGAGAQTADVSTAATYVVALTGNVTAVTLAGAPATGVEASLTFYFSQPSSGGTYTYTVGGWPASVQWLAGSAPVIATGASALTVVTLETFNGGTTWYGTGPAPPLPLPVPYGGSGATNLQPYQAVMGGITANSPVASQILPAKPPCRAATTGPLPANSYAGGSLTATFNGILPAVDGLTMVLNDRLIVANEAAQANNGIYQVRLLGTGTTITNALGIGGGATSMTVASATGITNGGTLRLDANNSGAENVTVTSVSGLTIGISACANSHANGAPVGVTAWAFDRVPDMIDTTPSTVQVPGATAWVTSGTQNANTEWAVQGPGPFTIGATAISWQQIGGAAMSPGGSGIIPTDLGLAAWTFDPGLCNSTHQPGGNGDMLLSAVVLRYPKTITELAFLLAGFATSPVAGQNWLILYPAAGGAPLASVDCTSLLSSGGGNSTGMVPVPVTGTALPAGQYILGAYFNASVLPTLGIYAAGSNATANAGFSVFRYGHIAGGYTTTPPSLTPGSVTQLANCYCMGMG